MNTDRDQFEAWVAKVLARYTDLSHVSLTAQITGSPKGTLVVIYKAMVNHTHQATGTSIEQAINRAIDRAEEDMASSRTVMVQAVVDYSSDDAEFSYDTPCA